MPLTTIAADIEWPDHAAAEQVRATLARAVGLGSLSALAEWIAGVRGAADGTGFARVRAVVIGPTSADDAPADIASGAVSIAGINALDDLPGTAAEAVEYGAAAADSEIDAGADLLIAALPAWGTDAAVAVAVLTNTEPAKVLSRGAAAVDPDAWMDRAVEVRDRRRQCKGLRDQPDELLDAIGSPALAACAAFVVRAAARRTPVVLDGPGTAAAALIGYEAQPRVVRWWSAADLGPDPMHELALTRLGRRPILGLGTGLGDGLAGLLAVPVLQAAARLAR